MKKLLQDHLAFVIAGLLGIILSILIIGPFAGLYDRFVPFSISILVKVIISFALYTLAFTLPISSQKSFSSKIALGAFLFFSTGLSEFVFLITQRGDVGFGVFFVFYILIRVLFLWLLLTGLLLIQKYKYSKLAKITLFFLILALLVFIVTLKNTQNTKQEVSDQRVKVHFNTIQKKQALLKEVISEGKLNGNLSGCVNFADDNSATVSECIHEILISRSDIQNINVCEVFPEEGWGIKRCLMGIAINTSRVSICEDAKIGDLRSLCIRAVVQKTGNKNYCNLISYEWQKRFCEDGNDHVY